MKLLSMLLFSCLFGTVAQAQVYRPFNERNLLNWETKQQKQGSKWVVKSVRMSPEHPKQLEIQSGRVALANMVTGHRQSVDIYTKEAYGSCVITLEVMVPKGANSGIYVMGEYEVQVFDSHGKTKVGGGDMGAIYGAAPPKVNACKAPGEWQKYEIHFQAPRFDDAGKKTANAKFIKVLLNGQLLHENVEMKGPTPGGVRGKEAAKGPLMFQGDHGPVAYRDIEIKATDG